MSFCSSIASIALPEVMQHQAIAKVRRLSRRATVLPIARNRTLARKVLPRCRSERRSEAAARTIDLPLSFAKPAALTVRRTDSDYLAIRAAIASRRLMAGNGGLRLMICPLCFDSEAVSGDLERRFAKQNTVQKKTVGGHVVPASLDVSRMSYIGAI